MEPQRQNSGYHGNQQSLRLRQASSPASNQNYPHFNWNSGPTEEDEVDGSETQRDLRALGLPLGLRRAVWQVQQMKIPVVSSSDSWKLKRAKTLRTIRTRGREVLSFLTLWKKTLQKIGGNFGGGVKSYFLFLRFLVVLNFFSFLLIGGFVLIPSIVLTSLDAQLVNNTEFWWQPELEECLEYDPNPQGLVRFYDYLLDLLSGTGFMESSVLFYGYYNVKQGSYNLPLAYLLTAVFYFAFCLICIIVRMGTAARVAVATGGGAVGNYSSIVFTGWDYGCLGDRATKLKQNNIRYQLKVDLEEERLKQQAAALTTTQRLLLYSLRVSMFFLALGFIAAALYGVAVATENSQGRSGDEGILGLIFEYLPSIAITAGNFVVPLLCDQIASVEKYPPTITIILALLRAVVLRLAGLIVLLSTLWSQITCHGHTTSGECQPCHYDHKNYPCWETRIGQEMYKLTLFDLLINLATLVLAEFPRRLLVDHWSNKLTQWVGRQEFVVPANVLGLVYGQTVVWTGALFCPLLPLINTVKFIVLFYCKKLTLFQNCRPAMKTFRSTTSNFFFLLVLVLGLSIATMVMIYSVAEIHPSMACGPFRFFPNIWSIVPNSLYSLSDVTQEFLFFIGSQAFSIPLFTLSCVVMCYIIALASVYGKSVALLRAQLKAEGKDKQFLVKQYEKLRQQLQIPEHSRGP
uniref:Transmembrane channel-like protein n=1 Tax=Acanthochromis polyacanthus TaxID=80966 RepID=A0A3Q1FB59_9TELE